MWNFKSMTDDDPMKFGFGSPGIKDKKKKKRKEEEEEEDDEEEEEGLQAR
ncbi:unnamed protein product [Brassica oleracea]